MRSILTTSAVAEERRFEFWQEAVCDTFVELDCKLLSDRSFAGEIATVNVEGFCFSMVRSRDHKADRTPHRIRHGREEVLLVSAMLTGNGIFVQDGREARIGPGDFLCYDSTRPYTLHFDGDFEQIVLHMPREMMAQHVGRTELFTARPVRRDSAMGQLVFPFLRNTASMLTTLEPVTAQRLADISLALITTAFGEMVCSEKNNQTCTRTAILYRAKSFVEEHLHEFELNTERVAGNLRISTRYLQDLFHAEGTTVSDWIWARRLEKCRQALLDPVRARISISQIATAAGFSDFGHFSRRFKAAYGLSPRDFRRASLKAPAPGSTAADRSTAGN
jgi:AraC-like DNA-binding protein